MNSFDDIPLALQSYAYQNLTGTDKEAAPRRQPRAVTATTNVNPIDREHDVNCTSAPVTLTLETAVGCAGRWHIFKKTDSGSNAMTVASSDLVEGAASINTTVQGITFMVWSTGATWRSVVLAPGTAAGVGTVTSVAQTVPAEFSIAGSPITTSGTLAITKATQTANKVWASATSGGAAQPAFRALVTADMPSGTGTVTSVALSMASDDTVSVSGSPVTTTGTLTATAVDANADKGVFWDDSAGKKVYFTAAGAVYFDGTTLTGKCLGQYLLGDQTTAITTGTKLTLRWRGCTLLEVFTFLATSGTGATTFDLKDDGTSVFSTKPSIDSTETSSTTGTAAVISNPTIGDHSEMTMILDAVGTGAKGFGFNFTFVPSV